MVSFVNAGSLRSWQILSTSRFSLDARFDTLSRNGTGGKDSSIVRTRLSFAPPQMSKITRAKCADIVQEFEPSTEAKLLGHLGIDGTQPPSARPVEYLDTLGFTNYLLSPECDLFNPKHRSVCQEMDQPLNHYFIASSYNTSALPLRPSDRATFHSFPLDFSWPIN